jgi:2-polyprenyl-3-methyl-5-hydroxy-6-metoxy-1,4-benzoquinol methylase
MSAAVAAKTDLVLADLFDTGLRSGAFDVAWNCGVIEHYQPDEIVAILREMARVTTPGGKIVVAIPNRRSLGVLTAALLGHKTLGRYLRWVPGYRNDTEILYSVRQIRTLIERATGARARVCYAGSPAWTFSPRWLVRFTGWLGKPLGCSFLVFFIVDKR